MGISVVMMGLPFLSRVTGSGVFEYGLPSGLILLGVFVVLFAVWFRLGRRDAADPLVRELGEEAGEESKGSLPVAVLLVIIGLAGLTMGGKLTETGAVAIARLLGLSQSLIGLTIVAVATSLPELATSVIALRKGHDDLAVGNVVGSNLFNILLVLGVTATVAPVGVPHPWGWCDLAVMTAITFVLLPIAMSNHRRITRAEGVLLTVIYTGYMTWGVLREL